MEKLMQKTRTVIITEANIIIGFSLARLLCQPKQPFKVIITAKNNKELKKTFD